MLRTTASWVSSFGAVSDLAGLDAGSRVWVPGPATASMNVFAVVHASYAGAELVGSPASATHAVLTPVALARLLDTGAPPGLVVVVERLVVLNFGRLVADGEPRSVMASGEVREIYLGIEA